MRELQPPPTVHEDPKSREIARVWAAHGAQHVTLDPSLWDDPGSWGLMLVDLAKHVAKAYEQASGRDRDEVLARIKAAMQAEWDNPTDEPKGSLA